MNSAELDFYLKEVAMGKIDALESIYQETKVAVYSFSLSILRNQQDAEDVLHDCYINIYKGAKNYQSSNKPMAWILTIAKNLCLKKINSVKRFPELLDNNWEAILQGNNGLTPEEQYVLRECLTALSEDERKIIILHAISGFKHKEIAEFLGIPISTVLSKYSRGMKKLQKQDTEG